MIHYMHHASPLGRLLLAATDQGLSGIYFEEHRHFKGIEGWKRVDGDATLNCAARQLDEYFAGRRVEFDLPLDLKGSEFQCKVWHALRQIPFGHTVSYMQHAESVGNPKALRAVGAAIGRNPVSIVVPCHRVIGASRAPTGYAGGLERKCSLLAFEGIQLL